MKKAVRWLITAVLVIWVVNNPAAVAQFAHHAGAWLSRAGQSLTTLTRNL